MPRRLTFSDALNSGLPKAVGLCQQDRADVAAYVNEAQEHLITDPLAPDEGFWGGWAHMRFNVTVTNNTAKITTPREVARIIVLDICNRPRQIRNGFYEYLQFGTGLQPKPCNTACCGTQQAFDRDCVPTLTDFPANAPQFLRFFPTNAADVGKRIVVQGPDKNGIQVLGLDPQTGLAIPGETVFLQFPFSTSVNEYQNVTGLLKDETNGPVQIYTVDPATLAQTLLSSMETNETSASYRQYFLNGLPTHCCNQPLGSVQVDAQCKLDFIPVESDTDPLIIQSIPALIEECQAIRYSRMDSQQAPALEAKHHARAISILNGQLDHYLGKVRTAVNVPIFGSNRLRPQPV